MLDAFGRRIDYLRMSVTDRCDLRCRYCMAETMDFLPRHELLSFDDLGMIADKFVARGVRRIRLTGGEPLSRRGIMGFARHIGRHVRAGQLDELTLTTNATWLAEFARGLVDAGVRRVNVSLDTRDPERFRHITRRGDVSRVLHGISEAQAAGLGVKINMVALKGLNEDEIPSMVQWCGEQGHDLTLIETMPLGVVDEDRTDRYLPLDTVRRDLERRFTLVPDTYRTGGPARYVRVAETGGRLGFITPLTHNFCDGCNRMRVTVQGRLTMCLGHEDDVDLKAALHAGGAAALDAAIDEALGRKPARHHFQIGERGGAPAVARHMSVTGG
jgi:cyclic pyranopterin phosphate synthase